MMFFVPYSDLGEEAEMQWCEARARLHRLGLPTTRRRIAALAIPGDGGEFILHVGMPNPACGEDVLMIFESSDRGLYYLCTPSNGLEEGAPYMLAEVRAFDFDEEAVGHA